VEIEKMKKNHKLQNTNYKQITKEVLPAVFSLIRISNYKCQYHKVNRVIEVDQALKKPTINLKGSYSLRQGSFMLQTITALIKSFCGGSRGAVFSKRAPLVAEGHAADKRFTLFDR
jgi:hypothetical protein